MKVRSPWRRHFLAVRPDPAAAQTLGALALEPGARRVAPADLHATLAFLDTLDEDGEARALAAAAAAVARAAPRAMALRLARVERWPTAWVACDDPASTSAALAAFVATLGEALVARGFPRERRAFRAHVTLARGRTGGSRATGALLVPPVLCTPAEVLLMANTAPRAPDAGRYTVRGRVPIPRAD